MRRLVLIICLLYLSLPTVDAQFFSTGSDPWHKRWRRLTNENITLVYDSLVEEQAKYLLSVLPTDFKDVSNGRLWNRRPFPVLLHSADANSNGLVSWAPRRMELYSYGDSESDCIPWLRHLAIHEGRHAWQTTLVENGQTTVLNCIFGQQATGLVLGLFVPRWLLEGDAVWQETDKTKGGRGRDAEWLQQDIALALNGEMPTYEQSFFGSYRNLYPDFYHMGYLLSAYGRMKYNKEGCADMWQQIMKECGRVPLSITPFNRTLRHLTGVRKNAFYREAMSYWHSRWRREYPDTCGKEGSGEVYTSYSHPQRYKDYVVSYRTSINSIAAFVKTDKEGRDEVILYPSFRNESQFHLKGDTIIWSERKLHPRWENASKNVIKWCRIDNPTEIHTIEPEWYYHLMSPHFASDGRLITAIEQLPDGHRDIIVMDINTRETEKRISFQIPDEPQYPIITKDNKLAYILLSEQGKRIVMTDLTTGEEVSTEPEYHNLRHLAEGSGGSLLYTTDEDGVNRIYQVDKLLKLKKSIVGSTPSVARLYSECSVGVEHPSVSNDTLLLSSYTRNGYKTTMLKMPVGEEVPTEKTSTGRRDYLQQESAEGEKAEGHPSYAAPHSWGPVSVDASSATIKPGLTAMSQNLLGTLSVQGGVNLDPNSTERFYAKMRYSAWYPVLSLQYSNQKEDVSFQLARVYIDKETNDTIVWRCIADGGRKTHRVLFGIDLPLQYASGAWTSAYNIGSNIEYRKESGYDLSCIGYKVRGMYGVPQSKVDICGYTKVTAANMSYSASMALLRRYALRQIGTRYGFSLSAVYKHTPWGCTDYGSLLAGSAVIYLPGIGHTHQISGSISYQRRRATKKDTSIKIDDNFVLPNRAMFGNVVPSSRGCSRVESERYTLLRTNYALPLCDPDLSLGPVMHIKRLSAKVFYDRGWGETYLFGRDGSRFVQESAGLELISESYFLQLPYRTDVGGRISYDLKERVFRGEMLLSVSFK